MTNHAAARRGSPRAIAHEEAERRFVERLLAGMVHTDTGCWEWAGAADNHGYGRIQRRDADGRWRPAKTHRASYEIHVGPIPDGLQLDHLCRNRICANPAHLEPVTNRVNALRGSGACGLNARKTECLRGHPYRPETTRFRTTAYGTTGRECLICDAELRLRREARRHATGAHECPTCGLRWETPRALAVHAARTHHDPNRTTP